MASEMHVGGGLGVGQLRQDLGEASVHICKTQVLDEASSVGSGSVAKPVQGW